MGYYPGKRHDDDLISIVYFNHNAIAEKQNIIKNVPWPQSVWGMFWLTMICIVADQNISQLSNNSV